MQSREPILSGEGRQPSPYLFNEEELHFPLKYTTKMSWLAIQNGIHCTLCHIGRTFSVVLGFASNWNVS